MSVNWRMVEGFRRFVSNVGAVSAVAVGSTIVVIGLWSSPIIGASMTCVRSLGPELVLGRVSSISVYPADRGRRFGAGTLD